MTTLKAIRSAYRVSIKGLVHDTEGRILLVRERGDFWDLPGGGLEHGEDVAVALKREFSEELDVDIKIDQSSVKVIPTWNTKFDSPVLLIVHKVSLIGEPSLTPEVQEFGYFSRENIEAINLDTTLILIVDTVFN